MARCSSRPDHSLERGSEAGAQIMSVLRKIGYSFVGLLAGDGALLAYVTWSTRDLERNPWQLLKIFCLYAIFTVLGWIVVGVPAVLLNGHRIYQENTLAIGIADRRSSWATGIIPDLFGLRHPERAVQSGRILG